MRNPSDPFFYYYKWLHVFLFIFSNDHLYGYEIFSPIELGFYWLIIPIHFATHVPLILCCKILYPLVFVEDFFLALWHGSAFWSSFSGFFFFWKIILFSFFLVRRLHCYLRCFMLLYMSHVIYEGLVDLTLELIGNKLNKWVCEVNWGFKKLQGFLSEWIPLPAQTSPFSVIKMIKGLGLLLPWNQIRWCILPPQTLQKVKK